MHVLRTCALLPKLVKERDEGCADGVSTDDLSRDGIEGEKGGGVRSEEVHEGVDVGMVKRRNKGAEHLFRFGRREGSARCAPSEKKEYESQVGKARSKMQEAESSGA
jgi:hypothetical protein